MVKGKRIISFVMLGFLLVSLAVSGTMVNEARGEKGYVKMETTIATYSVNQDFVDSYGSQKLSGLFDLVNERFESIMNITTWSSEKFYGHKLVVTIDPPSATNSEGGTGGYGSAHIFWGKEFPLTNESAKQTIVVCFFTK